jgi:hypothetical protein
MRDDCAPEHSFNDFGNNKVSLWGEGRGYVLLTKGDRGDLLRGPRVRG